MARKAVGGYHAAKLRRYQELIETHIQGEITSLFKKLPEVGGDMNQLGCRTNTVLNMLNTRYYIFPLQGGRAMSLLIRMLSGNAWFVDEVKYVDNANEEIEALRSIGPGTRR